MTQIFFIRAYPKVNISLKVFKKVKNLHPIESRFMLVCGEVYDDMFFVILDSADSKTLRDLAGRGGFAADNIQSQNFQYKDGLYLLGNFNCNVESNLIYRAFKLLGVVAKEILIFTRKNIPFGSGLGGGSVNAALTLLSLNKILNLRLSLESLKQMANVLGSDIAFFLTIYTQNYKNANEILFFQNLEMWLHDFLHDFENLAFQDSLKNSLQNSPQDSPQDSCQDSKLPENAFFSKNAFFSANISGFGEIISPFFELPLPLRLHTNNVSCETKKVYEAFDNLYFDTSSFERGANKMAGEKPPIDLTLSSEKILYNHSLDSLNDLYRPAVSVYPQLAEIKNELEKSGKNVFFSGSGGSFFSRIY